MNKEYNYFVYELIDPRTNTPYYIGKGQIVDAAGRRYRRIYEHTKMSDTANKLKCSISKKIIKEYGKIPHNIIAEGITESESFDLEIKLIKQYGRRSNNTGILSNLTDGGDGRSGFPHSEHTKRLISENNLEYYSKNDSPFKGKQHTQETRDKISESNKNYHKHNDNAMKGKHHTQEAKDKISKARKEQGLSLPKEEWHKYGSKGAKNVFAKCYNFIDPDGDIHTVEGGFKKFIKDNNLSLTVCKSYVDKGIIPAPKNPKHNRVTEARINTTGWEIKKLLKK